MIEGQGEARQVRQPPTRNLNLIALHAESLRSRLCSRNLSLWMNPKAAPVERSVNLIPLIRRHITQAPAGAIKAACNPRVKPR